MLEIIFFYIFFFFNFEVPHHNSIGTCIGSRPTFTCGRPPPPPFQRSGDWPGLIEIIALSNDIQLNWDKYNTDGVMQ